VAWGLLFAFLAAVCTAGATILQAVGVRHARHYAAIDPRLFLSVIRSLAYVAGLILLAVSFLLTLVALQNTALFVVQALSAASIAVVAAVSVLIFRTELHWVEWTAVACVCGGVALLVITQRPSPATTLPPIGAWAMLAAAVAIAVVAFTATHLLEGAAVPAILAGLAYGDAAVASRVVAHLDGSIGALLMSPATYAIVVSGLIGTLLYATALQRGSVPAVFGLSTVGQTIGPAMIGWLLLGDSVQSGTAPLAAVGFGLAVVGALVLGRHAHPEPDIAAAPRPPVVADAPDRPEATRVSTATRVPTASVRAPFTVRVRATLRAVSLPWRKPQRASSR
jgi:drug/metabolite transporter (DMT)-like permease